MTKAQIEDKLETFRAQHARALADVNALGGAIQLCELLIKEWDQPEAVALPIDAKDLP